MSLPYNRLPDNSGDDIECLKFEMAGGKIIYRVVSNLDSKLLYEFHGEENREKAKQFAEDAVFGRYYLRDKENT